MNVKPNNFNYMLLSNMYIQYKKTGIMYSENLKKIRKELRYTASETADILGVKLRTYGSWERGEKTPSIELCTLLCLKLNVNLNWFCTGSGDMFNTQENTQPASKESLRAEVIQILKEEKLL